MNSDLLRQRRNLMGISSGLLIFEYAKVSVSKISILGTELLIGDVKALAFITWTLWVYFFVRYYQYLKAEGDLGISITLRQNFYWKASQFVLKRFNLKHLNGEIKIQSNRLRWEYSIAEYDPSIGETRLTHSGKLPLLRTTWWRLQSLLHLVINTPKATDHILPPILAIAALIVSIVRLLQ